MQEIWPKPIGTKTGGTVVPPVDVAAAMGDERAGKQPAPATRGPGQQGRGNVTGHHEPRRQARAPGRGSTTTEPDPGTALPVRRNLAAIYVLSAIAAALMTTASVAGLVYSADIYPTDSLRRAFLTNDVVTLLIGVPTLLGCLWLASRDSLLGLLCWPGALFYALYNDLIYTLALPFGGAFALHLGLTLLSAATLVALLAGIDGAAVARRLTGTLPERVVGGVLAGFGLAFMLQASSALIGGLAGTSSLGSATLALHITDVLVAPAWVVGGVLLWRRSALGYLTGLGLLFQASMLFVGLLVLLLLQPLTSPAPLALTDLLVVLAMSMICFVPLALFTRGVTSTRRHSPHQAFGPDSRRRG